MDLEAKEQEVTIEVLDEGVEAGPEGPCCAAGFTAII